MEVDILEKGAILQRDKETFAVAPHIPGGFIRVADFRKLLEPIVLAPKNCLWSQRSDSN